MSCSYLFSKSSGVPLKGGGLVVCGFVRSINRLTIHAKKFTIGIFNKRYNQLGYFPFSTNRVVRKLRYSEARIYKAGRNSIALRNHLIPKVLENIADKSTLLKKTSTPNTETINVNRKVQNKLEYVNLLID